MPQLETEGRLPNLISCLSLCTLGGLDKEQTQFLSSSVIYRLDFLIISIRLNSAAEVSDVFCSLKPTLSYHET